jgi:succinate dehydrogenase / fumarate reductase, iron-sulfur subunit
MRIILHIWRQRNSGEPGRMVRYEVPNVNQEMSFLEMLDVLNEDLIVQGADPVAFDHDCREGICGTCGCMVNGVAHGPAPGTTLCQLHMRHFKDGDELYLEPWRARAFPVVKDLVVDRSAFDQRAIAMVAQAGRELFGSCTNIGECEAVCPKEIKLEVIARMNRDFIRASWT